MAHSQISILGLSQPVSALLFDLDDTLVDRSSAFRRWAESCIEELLPSLDSEQRQEAVRLLIQLDDDGYGVRMEVFTALKQVYSGLGASPDELVDRYYSGFPRTLELAGETVTLLEALRKKGIPFGIATNGSHRQMDKVVALGLDHMTSCIYISKVFGQGKPDPEIFLAAVSCLGLPADQILYVGDHPFVDIQGAHEVGLRTAWLRRGRTWPSDLPLTSADITIDSLGELLSREPPITMPITMPIRASTETRDGGGGSRPKQTKAD